MTHLDKKTRWADASNTRRWRWRWRGRLAADGCINSIVGRAASRLYFGEVGGKREREGGAGATKADCKAGKGNVPGPKRAEHGALKGKPRALLRRCVGIHGHGAQRERTASRVRPTALVWRDARAGARLLVADAAV